MSGRKRRSREVASVDNNEDEDEDDDARYTNKIPTLISNVQVYKVLQKRIVERQNAGTNLEGQQKKPSRRALKHRDWIEENVYEYLHSTTAIQLNGMNDEDNNNNIIINESKKPDDNNNNADDEGNNNNNIVVVSLEDTLATKYAKLLTEAERLQIINWLPTELVELHLTIEELHERMTTTQQEELLRIIQQYVEQKQQQLLLLQQQQQKQNEAAAAAEEEEEEAEEIVEEEYDDDNIVVEDQLQEEDIVVEEDAMIKPEPTVKIKQENGKSNNNGIKNK